MTLIGRNVDPDGMEPEVRTSGNRFDGDACVEDERIENLSKEEEKKVEEKKKQGKQGTKPAASSGNLIIGFMPSAQAKIMGPNWQYKQAKNLEDALKIASDYSKKFGLNNLVLLMHGDGNGGIKLGKDTNGKDQVLSVLDFALGTEKAAGFYKLIEQVSAGGDVAIVGCGAGQLLGRALTITNKTNVYMNNGLSKGGSYDIDSEGRILDAFRMDKPLNDSKDGWINATNDETFSNMIISRDGTIKPIK